jgi:hypothetical protein
MANLEKHDGKGPEKAKDMSSAVSSTEKIRTWVRFK